MHVRLEKIDLRQAMIATEERLLIGTQKKAEWKIIRRYDGRTVVSAASEEDEEEWRQR